MKTIKGTTKKGAAMIAAYNRSHATTIYQCYTRPSEAKKSAESRCILEMLRESKGRGYRIMSYNTMQFTCGWMTEKGLRVETANNSYFVEF